MQLWHRKPEWRLHALDPRENRAIVRVTPLDDGRPEGPWICNKARDLAAIFERPRALQPMLHGRSVTLDEAIEAARDVIERGTRRVAFVSSWGSNEELAAFRDAFEGRFRTFVKRDHRPLPGEPVEDDFLIRADKNPNTSAAAALFGRPDEGDAPSLLDGPPDVVLVWGEGFDIGDVPPGARTIVLDAYDHAGHAHADVFVPLSIQTERSGHYTNFQGIVRAFDACFRRPETVADAQALFARLGTRTAVAA